MLKGASTVKMAKDYLKVHSRSSYGEFSRPNSSRGSHTIVKHSNHQKNPNLPLRLKPYKMPLSNSSPKRSRAGNSNDERPSKLQKINSESPPKPTGLEESGIFAEVSEQVPSSTKTQEDREFYLHRHKFAGHASRIREKRVKASRVSPGWKYMPVASQQGMDNFTGYLCYRNSLLQALLHCPKIGNWLLKYHSPEKCIHTGDAPCIACEMHKLVKSYWSGKSNALLHASKSIHLSFRKNNWTPGSASGQADPDEQFTWIVGKLREQLPEQIFSYFLALNQPILNSSTKCTSCSHASSNPGEAEGSLSIELQPRIKNGTLAQYIHKYLTYVVTDYKCDSCSSTTPKTRTRNIAFSPDVLLVQLKRFDPFGRKDKFPVPLTPTIDLNAYRTECNKRNSTYELSAIVSHTGSLSFGHYRCTAKGPDGRWAIYNDEDMSRCSEKEALNPGSGTGWTPYLLFFQRVLARK